ncbi:c-type cytochrome [Aurantibacter crassamenti]|uniref:PVC-type heme-binding CxxCH protein n=1 Tax=Aurantibacter crassamenti TaxID=1837375 RepID=UPI001939728A|nr:PVC-type heme-binding CxxCH protein [Aurantibacter crassamenti]MBM1107776.1 c-type cytochrome [Aurantibacter crassamenti]
MIKIKTSLKDITLNKPNFILGLLIIGTFLLITACKNDIKKIEVNEGVAVDESLVEYMKNFEGVGALSDDSDPTPPLTALNNFKLLSDLKLDLVLSEPQINQPVELNFDHRGRLWVVQYTQYPYPKGLKVMGMDNYLRVKYDTVPLPPPTGVAGADKISFFEDTDGDGFYDKETNAISDLNIATSVTFGRGKIWVLNPPYLLAYPDAEGDGLPDGNPKVHLDGFGLEDTHAVANSLRWGPDGWLYGATGSTVTNNINSKNSKNVFFQGQAIWRYHPETEVFEVFAEGGGNTWHVEMDEKGRIFSGHNGVTRGMYFKQGAYYGKNWGKHGDLTNPYAFGTLSDMKMTGEEIRFTHAWIKYEGGSLPEKYNDKVFSLNSLQNYVQLSSIEHDGSTFMTHDIERVLETEDQWFRPVDIKTGPDGGVYMADWYDSRLSHVDPRDTWDKSTGRVYRIQGENKKGLQSFDISTYSNEQLIELLSNKNKWFRQQAQRQFGDRKNASVVSKLKSLLDSTNPQTALEALWAINVSGYFDEQVASTCLAHKDPFVRMWAVRLIGDSKNTSDVIGKQMLQMAKNEPNVEVRSQLATSAKRLPVMISLPIIKELLGNQKDNLDPDIPMLLWWALESKFENNQKDIIELFSDSRLWSKPIVQNYILERLMRRLILEGTNEDLEAATFLFKNLPSKKQAKPLWTGLQEGMLGKDMSSLPEHLINAIQPYVGMFGNAPLSFDISQKKQIAIDNALKIIANKNEDVENRLAYIKLIGDSKIEKSVSVFLNTMRDRSYRVSIRAACLKALTNFNDPEISAQVLDIYPIDLRSDESLKTEALYLFASRASWAKNFLHLIEVKKKVPVEDVPEQLVRQMLLLNDTTIAKTIKSLWPNVGPASSEDKNKRMAEILTILNNGQGNEINGKALYTNTCAMCHKLFDEGGEIGPDLTGYDRNNKKYMVFNVVDPSADIREGYVNYQIKLKDGRTVTGTLVEKSNKAITLKSFGGELSTFATNQIEEMSPNELSIMPERLVDNMTDQELRDLFAYISKN